MPHHIHPSFRLSNLPRFLALLLVCSAVPLSAAVTWDGAYVAAAENLPLAAGTFAGGLAFDEVGAPIVFDGEAVVRRGDGSWDEIYRSAGSVFGSFLTRQGGTLYFGESTNGTISAINLDTGDAVVVENLPFNFDLAFDATGRAFCSAPSPDSTMEAPRNGFYLLDLDPATPPDLILAVPGYSGPLTFDRGGNLFVATAAFGEPVDVYRFTPETILGGIGDGAVTEADGELFCADLAAAYGLTFGPFGYLYAADSVNGSVIAIDSDGVAFTWAAPQSGFSAATYLAFDSRGGTLGVINSDFAEVNQVTVLEPAATWEGDAVASAQDVPLPPPPNSFVGGFAFDDAGKPVVYDGSAIVAWSGGAWADVYRPEVPVFGSFVEAHDGTIYFGESSNGTINAITAGANAATVVETLAFNFDMAFDPGGRAFLSAPSPNGTQEAPKNGFYLADLDPSTAPDLVVELPGYSGPLTFSEDGTLYAAIGTFGEPADIYRFDPETLNRGIGDGFVTEADGELFAQGLGGAYSLTFGPFGLLFVGDSVSGQVTAVRRDGSFFPWAAPLEGFASATYVDHDPATGRLGVVSSDFATFNRVTLLETQFRFRRGLVNDDDELNIADSIAIWSFLFAGGGAPANLDRLDTNDDGGVDIADAVYLLSYQFAGGTEPPPPFDAWGFDPTGDELSR